MALDTKTPQSTVRSIRGSGWIYRNTSKPRRGLAPWPPRETWPGTRTHETAPTKSKQQSVCVSTHNGVGMYAREKLPRLPPCCGQGSTSRSIGVSLCRPARGDVCACSEIIALWPLAQRRMVYSLASGGCYMAAATQARGELKRPYCITPIHLEARGARTDPLISRPRGYLSSSPFIIPFKLPAAAAAPARSRRPTRSPRPLKPGIDITGPLLLPRAQAPPPVCWWQAGCPAPPAASIKKFAPFRYLPAAAACARCGRRIQSPRSLKPEIM